MKITQEQFVEWCTQEKPKCQRLGQWFCNYFNITDSQIFYCECSSVVHRLIYEKYLKD